MASWEDGWGADKSPPTDSFEKDRPIGDSSQAVDATSVTDTPAPKGLVDYEDYDGVQFGWVPKEELQHPTKPDLSERPQWSSEALKYEWKDEYGEVGPEDKELENYLFEDTYRPRLGEAFATIKKITVEIEGPENVHPIQTVDQAGFHPIVLENLKRSGYGTLTPIQMYTIPAALTGRDLIGIAQTGSGKTMAYLAPILSKLMGKADRYAKPKPNPETFDQKTNGITAEPLVLILVPTRELALQIYAEARRLCYRSKLRPSCVYGGANTGVQVNDLMRGCDILIGTPGRLADIVTTRPEALSLVRLKYTIFDEADELMDPDWDHKMAPMITGATAHHNDNRQFMMFSATFNRDARDAAHKYMEPDYLKIIVGRLGSTHMNIHQIVVWTEDSLKRKALLDLLKALPVARTMIFCASIDRAIELDDFLYRLNFPSNPLHSRLTQREREEAMEKFKRGSSPILVTTSLGGRGIDVMNVQHVVNFDMPSAQHGGIHAYCHQIGRTGRIGNLGQATSFYNDRNQDLGPDLAKLLMECNHDIPEFLQQYVPADGKVEWDDLRDNPMDMTTPLNQADSSDPNVLGSSWDAWASEKEPPSNNAFNASGSNGFDASNNNGFDASATVEGSAW